LCTIVRLVKRQTSCYDRLVSPMRTNGHLTKGKVIQLASIPLGGTELKDEAQRLVREYLETFEKAPESDFLLKRYFFDRYHEKGHLQDNANRAMTLFTSLGPSPDCMRLTQVTKYQERTGHAREATFSVLQRSFSLGWGLHGKVARMPHQSKERGGTVWTMSFLSRGLISDFSVVLFRSDFVLVSEKNRVKTHKNQWLWTMPYPPNALLEPQAEDQPRHLRRRSLHSDLTRNDPQRYELAAC
jgi:hypothetical protein